MNEYKLDSLSCFHLYLVSFTDTIRKAERLALSDELTIWIEGLP